jgi:hypothetical protein
MTKDEWVSFLKFQLHSLARENSYHAFEKLCMAFAKRRIASNLLPATGPVSAGGDQGRDFETFRSYLLPIPNGTEFERRVASDVICFACTTEAAARLKRKIRSDVLKIMQPTPDHAGPVPNRIFMFTSADIPVALRHQLQAWAHNTYSVSLEIIDGTALADGLASDDMVDSVVAHLRVARDLAPARSVLSILKEANERLSDASSDYGVSIHSHGAATQIGLAPRGPNLGTNAEFTLVLDFPETPEGDAAKREFDEHQRTGAPVVIPIQCIAEIKVPEPLESVLGLQKSSLGGIGLPARRPEHSFICDAIAESDDGGIASITGIELRVEQAGVEQVTLSNRHLPRSPHFTITVDWPRQSFNLAVEFPSGINVKQQLEAARFQSRASKGAIVKFVQVENGVPLVGGIVARGTWKSPSELFLEILEKLFEIQQTTGVLFSAPSTCTVQEARDVFQLATIVRAGEAAILSVVFKMQIEGVTATLAALDNSADRNGSFFFSSSDVSSVELFGKTIELGRTVTTIDNAFLTPDDRERLEVAVRANDNSQVHEIVLRAPSERPGIVRYEKWVSDQVRALYFREQWMIPSKD